MPAPLMCPDTLLSADLSDRVIIVTGANSGIGLETAKHLATHGATVILACRRVAEGQARAQEILTEHASAKISTRALDLASLASVREFAEGVLGVHDAIHGLVNNAGVMNTPQGKTSDGFETQFGVNHLGHFLLTQLLMGALKKGAPSRVVNLSSCFHDKAQGREGRIVLDDLFFEERKYDGWASYAQSKLANVLHARGLAKRLDGTGVVAVSVHPGWVESELIRHTLPGFLLSGAPYKFAVRPVLRAMGMISAWEGTQSSLYALLADDVEGGKYYSQVGIYREKEKCKGGWPMESPNPNVYDDEMVEKLWEKSCELVGTEAGASEEGI